MATRAGQAHGSRCRDKACGLNEGRKMNAASGDKSFAFGRSIDAGVFAFPDKPGQLINGDLDRIFPGADAGLLLDGLNAFQGIVVEYEFMADSKKYI
ncbi:MAG: hypothetical protein WBZ29_13030 [Methanocella sp.]